MDNDNNNNNNIYSNGVEPEKGTASAPESASESEYAGYGAEASETKAYSGYCEYKTEVSEPTVTYEAVNDSDRRNATGIKVFFALVAVMMTIVIALTAGFVFGKGKEDVSYGNTAVSKPELHSLSTDIMSDCAAVYSNVAPSVVNIVVYNSDGSKSATATGLVYSSDGYIVTNDHIYADIASPKFLVTMYDGKEYFAQFVAGDTRSDLAVLKINATGLKPVSFRNSDEIVVGEQTVAVGCPAGAVKATATVGIISSTATRISTELSTYTMKVIQTSTPINPGSSGGALVDMSSYVVGITSAKLSLTGYENIGYAIPAKTVVNVADSLIRHGYVEGRGKLGITYTFVDTITSELEGGIPRGLRIGEVSRESSFSGKNLQSGDIITHINDTALLNRDIALDIIESTPPGESLSFTVYHIGTKNTEVIYAALLSDNGNSSYTEDIFGENNDSVLDIFGDGDSYSDH